MRQAPSSSATRRPIMSPSGGTTCQSSPIVFRARKRPRAAGPERRRSLLFGVVALCVCLPIFMTACFSDSAGGGDIPASTREVLFGIVDPADVGVQGLTTGVAVESGDLPMQGPAIDV